MGPREAGGAGSPHQEHEARLAVTASGSWRLEWLEADGTPGRSPTFAIRAARDAPPAVRLVEPARPVPVRVTTEVPVLIAASDDLALAAVGLRLSRGDAEHLHVSEALASGRTARASRTLALAGLGVRPGDRLSLAAFARDRNGTETASSPTGLVVLDDAAAKEELLREVAGITARLRRAIAWQRRLADDLVRAHGTRAAVADEQRSLRRWLEETLALWDAPDLRGLEARARLGRLIPGPARAVEDDVRRGEPRAAAAQAAVATELEAIVRLLEDLAAALQRGDLDRALAAAAERSPRTVATPLLAGLKELVAEQQAVIARTKDLARVRPDDFTALDKAKLEALEQAEERLGRFLADAATDLSKVPRQDLSDPTVVNGLVQASTELQAAAGALAKKATELAVPLEESGLELAKSITENIERWLAEAPDSTKWVMEEPKGEADVPHSDLPSQLEDLIGDLLDKEDQLAEDAQDVTSSWLDSMDKGVGWTAADGPIANMSAKGVTGNLQPSSHEIGGRSGEGRSGKSSGQMVEGEAVGKGGKDTPARATPDAFEAGRVKDSSRDPGGGSTGGGKLSGQNAEGLRGAPAPEPKLALERLSGKQQAIREAAEKAKVAMERRGVRAQDLGAAIERMRRLEELFRDRRGGEYAREARAVSAALAAARKAVRDGVQVDRDTARAPVRERRDALAGGADEEIPAELRDWVRAYYRALSEDR